ncbi:MAG: hypothetical protein M0P13_08720 [Fibrobacteraceae bacterium]|nr:hypothetical protein [Fibrobacteraceae bacterium]
MKSLTILSLMAFSVSALFADDALQFMPDPYQLGSIPQGEVRHVTIKGANMTSKPIDIESVMCQGTGCSNYKFTPSVSSRSPVTVEFDLNTASMEGPLTNLVVLIGKDGKTYTTQIEGEVESPFFFSEKMFDAGYYTAGESREWNFYVWCSDKKAKPELALDTSSSREFTAEFKPVKLNVDKPDHVKEGGKIPGLKVTLKTKGMDRTKTPAKQKSISRIVSFKSSAFPKATPEVLVIGYWK